MENNGKPKSWPSSHTTVKKYILGHSEKIEKKIANQLQERIKSDIPFSASMDEWKSTAGRNYMNINAHHAEKKFNCLGLRRIKGRCPGTKLAQHFREHFDKYGVNLKSVVCVTTDGASIMNVFGRELPCLHLRVSLHGVESF